MMLNHGESEAEIKFQGKKEKNYENSNSQTWKEINPELDLRMVSQQTKNLMLVDFKNSKFLFYIFL